MVLNPFLSESRPHNAVDVVHTELCSLHMNPLLHSPEQLVIQTLFADGIIKYSLRDTPHRDGQPCFRILGSLEQIVPNSSHSMQWVPCPWGMAMTLARDVPSQLGEELAGFVEQLCARGQLTEQERTIAQFAVHPGGPRILQHVGQCLGLDEEQLRHSHKILSSRGNMSSATLPHIWQEMQRDDGVTHGQIVVSLAFGPGLTISGAIMRKELH
jgi:predicted naringenin-chalcone synthase